MKTKTKKRRKLQAARCELDRFENDVVHRIDLAQNRDKRRYKAGRNCPTAAWADAVWFGESHERVDGTTDRSRVEFPPGMDETGMILCCKCNRYTPRHNTVLLLICDDCADRRDNCPGGQPDAMVESVAALAAVYAIFRDNGLTDREIAVLSVWHEGRSVRECAGFFNRKKSTIHEILAAAQQKLARRGLTIPARQFVPKAGRPRLIGPEKLEKMTSRRY